jgi:hypothetical protein
MVFEKNEWVGWDLLKKGRTKCQKFCRFLRTKFFTCQNFLSLLYIFRIIYTLSTIYSERNRNVFELFRGLRFALIRTSLSWGLTTFFYKRCYGYLKEERWSCASWKWVYQTQEYCFVWYIWKVWFYLLVKTFTVVIFVHENLVTIKKAWFRESEPKTPTLYGSNKITCCPLKLINTEREK